MCKFQKPVIPANATDDERRAVMFDALYSSLIPQHYYKIFFLST